MASSALVKGKRVSNDAGRGGCRISRFAELACAISPNWALHTPGTSNNAAKPTKAMPGDRIPIIAAEWVGRTKPSLLEQVGHARLLFL